MFPARTAPLHKALVGFLLLSGITLVFMTLGCHWDRYGNFPGEVDVVGAKVLSGVVTKTTVTTSIQARINPAQAAALKGQVIKGAEVWIEELPDVPHQITDDNGVFVFGNIPQGTYRVIAKYQQGGKTFKKRSEEMTPIDPNQQTAALVELLLLEATKVVSGILRDENGNPLPEGVELSLWGEIFRTGPGGVFTSPPVPSDVQQAPIVVKSQGGRQAKTFDAPFVSADQPVILDVRIPNLNSTETPPPNPFITGVKNGVFTNVVYPNETIDLTAHAGALSKEELAKLTFKWETTLGVLTPKANPWEHLWQAPLGGGIATVTVTVTDEKGRPGIAHFRTGFTTQALAIVRRSWDTAPIGANTTVLTVEFNQPLVPSTVDAAIFQVRQGETAVPGKLELTTDNKVIKFTANAPLGAGTPTTVSISQHLRGITGGTLPTPTTLTVATVARPVIAGITAGSFKTNQKFTLTGETDATLEYSLDGGTTWQVYTGETTISTEGTINLIARQTTKDGRISPTTDPLTVTLDKTAPATPVIAGLTAGTFNTDRTFTATGEAGATIEYSLDNGATWKTYTGAVTIANEGTYAVTTRQTDAAGNVSPLSAAVTVTIDKTAPTAPVIAGLTAGTFNTDRTFTVTGEPGATIEYSLDNGATWKTYTGEVTIANEGTYAVTTRQTDAAGNVSPLTAAVTVTISKAPPAAPTIAGLTAGTFNTNRTFTVTGEAGTTIEYSLDNGNTWIPYTGAVTIANEGSYTITARQTNSAGAVSAKAAPIAITMDKTPPAAPSIAGLTAGTFTTDQKFTVSGEPGATIQYSLNNGTTWTTYSGEVTLSTNDSYQVTARQTDAAGNISPSASAIAVTINKVVGPAFDTANLSPSNGAIEVDISTVVKIPATVDLDGSTVTADHVTVKDGDTALSGNVAYNAGTRTITFTPNSDFPQGKTLTISVTSGVKKADGSAVAPLTSTFTTLKVSDLIAWYKFENNLYDSSGNNHTLTPVGSPQLKTDKAKVGAYSAYFNGSSRYSIDNGANFNMGSKFTVTCWVYIPSLTSSLKTIMANGTAGEQQPGFKLCVNSWQKLDRKITIEAGDGIKGAKVVTPDNFVQDGAWYHLAFIIDKTTPFWGFYFNGVKANPTSVTSDTGADEAYFNANIKSFVNTNQPTVIGAFRDGTYGFVGYIDDLRVYGKVLSDAEIQQISQQK
ncbi:MAG: T1SS secreted agglutinin RTX [Candidatus Ozemobacter sibiricus]|uniref:T1SS secreted agglutinin RTX n=1 Tax=Candidatus Ozemobacter sibiricus TaxID=2268124 RepID=A0A367ZNG1_9BACT|nr:MAG: T1SS secreted agglutinin RTX [Candidatus Ozemobacter sibiricus]